VWNLVVGDVILLEGGARVPADCLVIESDDLEVDEDETRNDDNQNIKKKRALSKPDRNQRSYDDDADPFLFMNNLVTKGKCKVLVLAVGDSSSRNKEANKLSVDESTELGIKLKNLADQFMKYAIFSALLIFVILNVRMLIEVAAGGDLMRKVVNNLNICIILIIVSVPEGLPLTIQISLAFSVFKMIKQQILVRDLNAPEKMGSIEELCCSKTATLTQNKMKVS
tara:strand:- start:1161 stop:1835 length:675 start_codon:yes stop_codon:yes gene_type:complete